MTSTQSASTTEIPTISDAVSAARLGDPALARRLFDQILDANPLNEQALLWKAVLCTDNESTQYYLEQVLEINPSNDRAFETLRMLRKPGTDSAAPEDPTPEHACPVCYETLPGGSSECQGCGMTLTLAPWTTFLSNQGVNEVRVLEAIRGWRQCMQQAPSGGLAFLIALGYLNLKRSGEASVYLEKARNLGVFEPGMDELLAYFRTQRLVLAVDANSLVRRFLNTVLTRAGFRVVTAENGDDGARMFDELKPDLVVCDYTAPGRSGFELCRYIRKSGWGTPVVLMSGKLVDRVKAHLAGATDWIAKPFEPENIAAVVRRNLAA